MTNNKTAYLWNKYPLLGKDWVLELFNSMEDKNNDGLLFMMQRPDVKPHSLILNLSHPSTNKQHHAELEIYEGILGDGRFLKQRSYAIFSKGRFMGGTDFNEDNVKTLREFRWSLDHYFQEREFQTSFGEHLHEFLANSNLYENVIAAYSELFD